jgi:hypothetical protein
MAAFLRKVLYFGCIVTALICGIAALTIAVAIVANRLPDDPQAWMSVVFFAAVSAGAWIARRAAN